jgi:ABC-type bacteriocin/lantibiotic exporter with double-glycine peptidase domain
MKRIRQKDDYGCGLACVAMLADADYQTVRESYEAEDVDGTQLRELKKIMRRHGVRCGPRLIPLRSRHPKDLPFDALLKVNPRLGGKDWHWVLWDSRRKQLLDPKVPRYKRYKYVSFVRVWRRDR